MPFIFANAANSYHGSMKNTSRNTSRVQAVATRRSCAVLYVRDLLTPLASRVARFQLAGLFGRGQEIAAANPGPASAIRSGRRPGRCVGINAVMVAGATTTASAGEASHPKEVGIFQPPGRSRAFLVARRPLDEENPMRRRSSVTWYARGWPDRMTLQSRWR
jgi:hypothetical protein